MDARRESSLDPVKAQGILTQLTRKERNAARLWQDRWSWLNRFKKIQEEEALKIGISLEDYHEAVRSRNCRPEPQQYPVVVDPSPNALPRTSTGMIGRRACCPLERYGRLMKTSRDYPTRPPLRPGQIYDPYKQTVIFLGIDVGDPISYKLPTARSEVTDEMWARTRHQATAPLNEHLQNELLKM